MGAVPERSRSGEASVLAFPKAGRSQPVDESTRHGVGSAPNELRTVLGEVLREERQRQDRTLADVANEAAVSLAYLSEVERGRKDVSSELLSAVCGALQIPLATVLEHCVERLQVRAQGSSQFRLCAA
jgi:hypothetical protein